KTQKNIVESDDDGNGDDHANIERTTEMGLLAEIVNKIELKIKSLSELPSSDEEGDLFNSSKDSVQSEGGPESSSKKVTSSDIKDI
ncbi:34426_t:CDS:2, partial [Gigaspora margarita]